MCKTKIMFKQRSLSLFFGMCLMAIAGLAAPSLVVAAQFSADVTIVTYGKAAKGKLYVRGETYRMELVKGDKSVEVLVDDKAGLTRVLVHSKKIYLEMKNDDLRSAMNNPFVSYQISQSQYGSEDAGQEIVTGYQCTKQHTKSYGKDFLTAWISDKLGFPIKIVNHLRKGDLTELTNIQEGPQKESLFRPPAGYVKMDRMPIERPSWAEDVPKAPIRKVPFEETLSKGNIIRASLIKGYKITVRGENLLEGKTAVTAVAFKDGSPVSKPSMNTFNVSRKGQKLSFAIQETIVQADEIVIRVGEGKALIRTELVEAPEGISLKKVQLEANSGKQIRISHKKAARVIINDNAKDGKQSRGTYIIYTTIEKDMGGGATAYDKEELYRGKFLIENGGSHGWQFEKKQAIGCVEVNVLEGGVTTRIEQPIKAGTIPPSWAEAPMKSATASASSGPAAAPAPAKKAATPAPQAAPSVAASSGPARMVLVLDGSGSMWGQIDGKAKIAIAKEVMAELIDQIPKDFHTGLTVYGHRRKGDCQDIEMLMPVGPHNPAAMKAKVQAISPKGKTPLSESVRRAAQALRYTEERATVVLVSDGLETCDIDPCELAAELAMSGVDFTVHVIGFDISKEDQHQLRCMADKTGGLFLAASDAVSLRDALFKTVEEVKAPPVPVVEDPGTAVLKGPASVPVGSDFTVQWEGPNSRGDLIAIVKKGERNITYVDYIYTKRGNPAKLTAPGAVGDYELRYVHGHSGKVIGRADLKATPVKASVKAPPSAKVAIDIDVTWQGPDNRGDYIAVVPPGQGADRRIKYTYTQKGSPLKLRMPSDPGTYDVIYLMRQGKTILARTSIQIQPAGASVQAPATAAAASLIEVTWQGPNNQMDYIAVVPPGQGADRRIKYTYTKKGSPLKLRMPSDPGTYDVIYLMSQGKKVLARTSIEITR